MDELSGDIGGTTSSAPAAPPVADTSGASNTGAATIEPGATEQDGATTGPIPFDRHRAILENARRKSAEEVEARYAHLRDVDADSVRNWQSWNRMLENDPNLAVQALVNQLRREGRLRPPQRPTNGADQKPQPDLRTEDGRAVYSAEQAERLWEWRERQLEARWAERLGPIEQRNAQRDLEQQVNAEANSELQYMRSTLPHFTEHEKEIKALCESDKRFTVRGAYDRIVLPKIRQLERESVVKELNSKATAGSVNPSSPSTAQPKDVKKMSWTEAFKSEWDKAKARAGGK